MSRGIFGKSYHPVYEIPLETIKSVSSGGLLLRYISILDSEGENIFHLKVPETSHYIDELEFSPVLQSAIELRKKEIKAEKKAEKIHVLLDFSFLRDYMKQGGLVLQKIQCPTCAAPISLPETGKKITCKHCGSTILAQDIFEKIKALIG